MFQLALTVCLSLGTCEHLSVPVAYPSEARCAAQAAIVAGMVRGRHRSLHTLSYVYACTPAGTPVAEVRTERSTAR